MSECETTSQRSQDLFYPIPFIENYEVALNAIFRNTQTKKIKHSSTNKGGYKVIILNGKAYYVHQILAKMFVGNPNNYEVVDHINHIRSDNRVENLRWVSQSNNLKNKSHFKSVVYEYLDKIPEQATQIFSLKGSNFDNLFYFNHEFYIDCNVNVRKLHGNQQGKQFIYSTYNVNNQRVFFSVKQFLEHYPQFRSDFEVKDINVTESHTENHSESHPEMNIDSKFDTPTETNIEIINEVNIKSDANSTSDSTSDSDFKYD